MRLHITIWPECPAEYDHNGLALVLLDLPPGTRRNDARALTRSTLQTMAGRLSGVSAARLQLSDIGHKPSLTEIADDIDISLSYAADKALIGLCRGRAIGVDIVAIENIPEIEILSNTYLPKTARLTVLKATCRDTSFALAWAQMEACCKAANLPLAEISEARESVYADCELLECEKIRGYRMAVALRNK